MQTINPRKTVQEQHSKQDKLQAYLDRHTKVLVEEANRSDGQVAETKLQELERLSRLIQLQKAAAPPPPKFRWPVILLLAGTLVVLSILFFARVGSTEIELDLSLSELNFRITESQLLSREMNVASLGLAGADRIDMPRFATKEARTMVAEGGSVLSLQLSSRTDTAQQQGGSITLGAITLNKGAQVGVQPAEPKGQHRLFINSRQLNLSATVHGSVAISQPGTAEQEAQFPVPKSIVFQAGSGEVDLAIDPVEENGTRFSKQLLADSLSLFSVDKHNNSQQTVVRRISTILSGTLYFESLGGTEKQLRPGQALRFTSSTGLVRTLEVKDGHIAFAFSGRVEGMTTGTDGDRVSLMPTYLDWLKARHGLSLLWGSTLYFFGLLLGIIRWWKTA